MDEEAVLNIKMRESEYKQLIKDQNKLRKLFQLSAHLEDMLNILCGQDIEEIND